MRFITVALLPLLLSGCVMKNASETPAKPIKAVAADHINLQLPPAVYAVPGVEISIYFDNIVNVINPDNYVFDVTCAKGRNDRKRWRYTPAAGEKGSFDWEVKVISDKGIEAVGKTKIIVTPADTGKGKNFAVLILGDSLTAASIYPQQLYDLLTANGHPGACCNEFRC